MLAIGSDNVIELVSLTDETTGLTVTGATVTGKLLTLAGAIVQDTFTLSHVANGTYRGEIPSSVTLTEDTPYILEIRAVSGAADIYIKHRELAGYLDGN